MSVVEERAKAQRMLLNRRLDGLRNLYPGYFALVMATGIVARACDLLHVTLLANALFAVNVVAFPVLVAATVARAVLYPAAFWSDLIDPKRVFAFFTIVAAADVLGIQCVVHGQPAVAWTLWSLALVVWVLLSYLSFFVLTLRNEQGGADVVRGGWLVAIVGAESLVLLLLKFPAGALGNAQYLIAVMFWGVGAVMYAIYVTIFSFRLYYARVTSEDLSPLFWVIMGAAAISVNAGVALVLDAPATPFAVAMRSFVSGSTSVFWGWATWWIPFLVILGVWKYVVKRDRLIYDPAMWNVVFPLGMYTVATYHFHRMVDVAQLEIIPKVMIWAAVIAWTAGAAGLLASFVSSLAQTSAE
ncbi:C4-dicarboxylate ABC transporter [bacterium]|nr:MAG: C4-dicarboxylate ABC transporter [bacterium]